MNQTLGALGTPQVGFFMLILIGAVAGWVAERVTRSDHGIFTNILVGVAGSFVGSSLADAFGIAIRGRLGYLMAAIVGAIIVIWLWRAIRGDRRRLPAPGPFDMR
ncbi:MAG: GlsB/YeaQ/YmgE family stress response membrane protein [Beijerinckiaceae bacterium]